MEGVITVTTKERQELIRLLGLYCNDLLNANDANIRAVENARKAGKSKWDAGVQLKSGVKAQYQHARIVMTKLLVEIGNEVKSSYEL